MIWEYLGALFAMAFLLAAVVSLAILVGALIFVRTGGHIELGYVEDDDEDENDG